MGDARTILHGDMDAFYAAVEQRDEPRYRGKPVIVGGLGKRGVVSTASYEARKFGVHSALPMAVARRLCPDGIYVRPRMEVYAAISRTIRATFEEFTPVIEPLSLDEAFLDVTGCRMLFGDGASIAKELKQRVHARTGLRISVGVAQSKFVAKVASDLGKPDGLLVVPPGTEIDFLGRLPVRRLWGAGKKTQARLIQFGMRTIADLQRAGEQSLVAHFGPTMGGHYWRLCRGLDKRPVESARHAKSISHEVTFADDLTDTRECHAVLLELSEGVGRRLRSAALVGRTVKLKLRFPPFETLVRQVKLEVPSDDDLVIHRHARALFDQVRGGRPVRLLGVGSSDLEEANAARQLGLFDGDRDKGRDVLRAMDEIRDRFGESAIQHGGVSDLGRHAADESDTTPQ